MVILSGVPLVLSAVEGRVSVFPRIVGRGT